eukprot:754882-Hanusia_phi.AAC.2
MKVILHQHTDIPSMPYPFNVDGSQIMVTNIDNKGATHAGMKPLQGPAYLLELRAHSSSIVSCRGADLKLSQPIKLIDHTYPLQQTSFCASIPPSPPAPYHVLQDCAQHLRVTLRNRHERYIRYCRYFSLKVTCKTRSPVLSVSCQRSQGWGDIGR